MQLPDNDSMPLEFHPVESVASRHFDRVAEPRMRNYSHINQNLSNPKFWSFLVSISQCIRMDLNKRSGPKQKTITASKGTP